jgi:hypothetical protein
MSKRPRGGRGGEGRGREAAREARGGARAKENFVWYVEGEVKGDKAGEEARREVGGIDEVDEERKEGEEERKHASKEDKRRKSKESDEDRGREFEDGG